MTTFICKKFNELSLYELYEIMALRQEVFVVEQNCPYLDADGKDQSAWHLMGLNENKKLVAYSIGRVVTSTSARGGGIGRELMEQSIQWMEKLFPAQDIKIGAQCYLEKFYKSLGFEIAGDEYLEDGIPHYPMLRKA